MREQRVFADHREWVVQWVLGHEAPEIVSVHSTDDITFEVEEDVTDEIEGTKRQQKIYEALEVALQRERHDDY